MIPVMNFVCILGLNLAVSIQLLLQRRFRTLHARSSCDDIPKDNQAIQMLLACAAVYVITQFPIFIYNILRLQQRYPNCAFVFTDQMQAIFNRLNSVAINLNYSVNFFLYYGISSSFRRGFFQLFQRHEPILRIRPCYPILSKGLDFITFTNSSQETSSAEKVSLAAHSSSKTVISGISLEWIWDLSYSWWATHKSFKFPFNQLFSLRACRKSAVKQLAQYRCVLPINKNS